MHPRTSASSSASSPQRHSPVNTLATILRHKNAGLKKARELVEAGITTRGQLLKSPLYDTLPRSMQVAVKYKISSLTYESAKPIVTELKRRLGYETVIPVGSFRRKERRIADLDFIVINQKSDLILTSRGKICVEDYVLCGQKRKMLIISRDGKFYKLDLFVTEKRDLPFALFHYTGSKAYNIRVRAYVKRLGYTLNQYGIFDGKTKLRYNIRTEKELAEFIGITYRDATNR